MMLWIGMTAQWRITSLNFFFQAEDGIRDVAVTGVQTCALPIYTVKHLLRVETGVMGRGTYQILAYYDPAQPWAPWAPQKGRSEERRVGKECRSRWSPYH